MQKLSVEKFNTIKTQRCTKEDCPVYKMFSTEVRARHFQLVFSIDKCCLDCFGYHTDVDRRRKPFQKIDNGQKLAYSENYMLDFSSIIRKNQEHKEIQAQIKQVLKQNNSVLSQSCYNNIQHLYHPVIYKTIKCPFQNKNDKQTSSVTKQTFCRHLYCPFIHHEETLDTQLQKKLIEYRDKNNYESMKQNKFTLQKKQFQDKIMNLVLLRTSKSIEDFNARQMNLFKNQDPSSHYLNQSSQKKQILSDTEQIQRMKQKLKQNVRKWTKIDQLNNQQQQSRKIIDKNSIKEKQSKKLSSKVSKNTEQIENDSIGVTYNYFKYGEKLSLIESRTIQFKHFKDISDPNHIPLIMRYITAFLNTEGGKLYIGVDDNSYVYGSKFKQSEYDKLLLNIDRQCRFCLNPPLMPQKYNIKLIPVYQEKKQPQKDKQRWVIEITVFPTKQSKKKLFLYNRECYMRMNASTHKLNASDIIEYISLNAQTHIQQTIKNQDGQKQIKEQTLTHTQQKVTFVARQNQLINHNLSIQKQARSCSKTKFQTEESKTNQFLQQVNKKSIQDLYLLKKQFEQKLMVVIQAYKKKQRQMR